MQKETAIIHAIPVDELTGAISVPIYQTSTYVQESPAFTKGMTMPAVIIQHAKHWKI